MRINNPLANSYTKNQTDNKFLTVNTSGSESGTANPINADTLNGKPASDYVLKSEIYPVGSIYMSIDTTDPSTYFGGTWERIMGRFLLSADDSTYLAGKTGGEATHTLTTNEMPAHKHVWARGFYSNTQGGYGLHGDTFKGSMSASETASIGDTETTGGGTAHNNMPPYLVVYVWKRTA